MNSKYLKIPVEDYLANESFFEKQATLYGELGLEKDCMPVGTYNGFMATEKADPNNMAMAQYNIRDRFGYLTEDDESPSNNT